MRTCGECGTRWLVDDVGVSALSGLARPGSLITMKRQEILEKLKAGELEIDEATKLLEKADEPKRGLYCKVSQKGGISVYGLQRMPVTLYVEQWERLLGFTDEIKQFIAEHQSEFKRKGQAKD